jgi:hypothetical protein
VTAAPSFSLRAGPEAVREYLASAALPHPLRRLRDEDPGVTYVDAGIMNYVYRVAAPSGVYYLKQALPEVKEAGRLGADLAGVSPARIAADARALLLLAESLPPSHRGSFPTPLWHDTAANILWTRELFPAGEPLHVGLLRGECSAAVAREAGRLLGIVHGARRGAVPPLWPSEAEDLANWRRFLQMRTVGVIADSGLPPAAVSAAWSLYEDAQRVARPAMLSHLDAAPKNFLVGPAGQVALLDFELGASVSDPAYDPGFLIGHYLLMGASRPEMVQAARSCAAVIEASYLAAAPPVDAGWPERLRRYAAMTMLYRLYGSSKAPYIGPTRHAAVRRDALRRLTEEETGW